MADNYTEEYSIITVDGRKRFCCHHCHKELSTKQRVISHFRSKHLGNESEITGPKEDCFAFHHEERKYRCKICHKFLSTRNRILSHLVTIHSKSPQKSVYKKYFADHTLQIPKRTLMRKKQGDPSKQQSFTSDESEDNISDEEDEYMSDSEEYTGVCSEICKETNNCTSLKESTGTENVNADGVSHFSNNHADPLVLSDMASDSNNYDEHEVKDCDIESSGSNEDNDSEDSDKESISESINSSESESDNSSEMNEQGGAEILSEEEVETYCIMAYVLRHNLSFDARKDLIKLLKTLCPDKNFGNKLTLLETVNKNVHYCTKCNEMFPNNPDIYICTNCGNYRYKGNLNEQNQASRQPKGEFIIADIGSQLKQLLERKKVWESVQKTKESARVPENDDICDIIHGSYYQQLCKPGNFLYEKSHLSSIFNTDGIPLYKSSKVKLWPIFLALNEIPASSRFSRENIIVAGIWQGKGNPPFKQYMHAFGEEINKLYENGVDIHPPKELESVTVKIGVFCGTVDLQAKGYILNMTMFNGEYGCSTCEEPGKVVRKGKGHVRCYLYKPVLERPPERVSNDIINVKGPQSTRINRMKGICGVSGLASLPGFDIVNGMVPDYMHGVLLGATKTLLILWFSSVNSQKEFFAGDNISEISKRFQNIQPPDFIERLPRDFEKNYTNFKATELQSWLLYYAIPCMEGFLPDEYIKHLSLLSEGIYLLLGDRISRNELQRAGQLLERFYEQFSELYGENSCGLNFHNIGAHLTFFVEKWGPLWSWSCFPFEDANAAILQAVHGTGVVTHQYLQLKQLECKVSQLDLDKIVCKDTRTFLGKMKTKSRKWCSLKPMCNVKIAGALTPLSHASDELLTLTNASSLLSLKQALRVEVDGEKIYSKLYPRMKKRVCNVVCCRNGNLVSINHFLVNTETKQVYAVAERLDILGTFYANHIFKIRHTEINCIIPVEDVMEKVFYIHVDTDKIYLTRLPNILGHCVFK